MDVLDFKGEITRVRFLERSRSYNGLTEQKAVIQFGGMTFIAWLPVFTEWF